MAEKNWKEVFEAVGMAAIVVSLIFVGLQLRQSDKIALGETNAVFLQASIEVASLLNDNAAIWLAGNKGEELDEAEQLIFRNLVIAVNDHYYTAQVQFRTLGDDESAAIGIHDFAAFLFQHPGARRVWTEREVRLRKYRNLLNPGGEDYSYYGEAVLADLEILDAIDE